MRNADVMNQTEKKEFLFSNMDLRKLILPLILEQTLAITVGMADTMMNNGMAIFLWPASFVLPNMLRACNDVKFPMVISIFSMFVFRIGLSYILGVQMGMGAIGVWNAMVVDWIFRTICFVGRYRMGRWKKTMYLLLN